MLNLISAPYGNRFPKQGIKLRRESSPNLVTSRHGEPRYVAAGPTERSLVAVVTVANLNAAKLKIDSPTDLSIVLLAGNDLAGGYQPPIAQQAQKCAGSAGASSWYLVF